MQPLKVTNLCACLGVRRRVFVSLVCGVHARVSCGRWSVGSEWSKFLSVPFGAEVECGGLWLGRGGIGTGDFITCADRKSERRKSGVSSEEKSEICKNRFVQIRSLGSDSAEYVIAILISSLGF